MSIGLFIPCYTDALFPEVGITTRYREDLCLPAGVEIEARGTPPAPIDPKS